MFLTIDMQGALTDSRFRGIGRYTLGLVRALIQKKAPGDDILLVLNGSLGEGIDHVRSALGNLLPEDAFRIWYPPGPSNCFLPETANSQKASELLYARFIESLKPDAVLYSSIFDSPVDPSPAPSRLQGKCHQSAITYDFIPLHEGRNAYLSDPLHRNWFFSRMEELKSLSALFCISDFVAQEAAERIPGPKSFAISSDTDAFFRRENALPLSSLDITSSWGRLDGRPFVLYSGGAESRKNIGALIKAFSRLPDDVRRAHQLAIVCGRYKDTSLCLQKALTDAGLTSKDAVLLDYVSDKALCSLYAACRLFVFPSLDEGFGLPVLEAMRCGAPVIASCVTSIPEVTGLSEALFDPADVSSIAEKMTQALTDEAFLKRLTDHSRVQHQKFSWENSASKVWDTLREEVPRFQKTGTFLPAPVLSADTEADFEFCRSLARLLPDRLIQTADSLDRTFPAPAEESTPHQRQLFVDISELSHVDAGTGIQRVTRSILLHLLKNPIDGYVVRPVYATNDRHGYRYAHRYALDKFGFDDGQTGDFTIIDRPGDFFLGLDWQPVIVPRQLPMLRRIHRNGIPVMFFVHDLIAVKHPEFVFNGLPPLFLNWLRAITQFDGVICNSRSTADDYEQWLRSNAPERVTRQTIRWVHLGSDIEGSVPTRGMPEDAAETLEALKKRPSFLMVSTVEPRKGYAHALRAFELLWQSGEDVNFVIVGRQGWRVEALTEKLQNHPEAGKRLFWLKGISDEYLEKVYEAASAVIMASEAEGFGLSVVEGAQHKKPLILRDLPVFREIAGESALYFKGKGEDLAEAIRLWMKLDAKGLAPSSDGVEQLTWEQCTRNLLKCLPLQRSNH